MSWHSRQPHPRPLLVLKGLTDADWRLVQAAVVEVHDEDGKLDAIKALFVKAGLTKVDVVQEAAFEGTTVYTLIACRGDGSGRGRAGRVRGSSQESGSA